MVNVIKTGKWKTTDLFILQYNALIWQLQHCLKFSWLCLGVHSPCLRYGKEGDGLSFMQKS